MAENGRVPSSDLASIPGGELRKDAAAAWNAPGGPASAGLRPGGSMSSYRTYDEQVYLYDLYLHHGGNLAAVPGTSNHGWGIAIDCPNGWEQSWLREHGAKFGWEKTEAFSEPWHWNFVGGVGPFKPAFESLSYGDRGRRVEHFAKRLAFIHPSDHAAYLKKPSGRFTKEMRQAVRHFQIDQAMQADGVIGEHTAHRIQHVFEKQYAHRGGKD